MDAIEAFAKKWGIEAHAEDYLRWMSPEASRVVIKQFDPKADTKDITGRLLTFAKSIETSKGKGKGKAVKVSYGMTDTSGTPDNEDQPAGDEDEHGCSRAAYDRTIYVTNLAQATTDKDLHDYLSEAGTISSTHWIRPRNPTKRELAYWKNNPRGTWSHWSAKVVFESSEEASRAVEEMNFSTLKDATIQVRLFEDLEERKKKREESTTTGESTKWIVYLDEIPMPERPSIEPAETDREVFADPIDMDPSSRKEWIELFGPAEDVYVFKCNRVLTQSLYRGYVRFRTHEAAKACVASGTAVWSESERALTRDMCDEYGGEKDPYAALLLPWLTGHCYYGGGSGLNQLRVASGLDRLSLMLPPQEGSPEGSSTHPAAISRAARLALRRVHFTCLGNLTSFASLVAELQELLCSIHNGQKFADREGLQWRTAKGFQRLTTDSVRGFGQPRGEWTGQGRKRQGPAECFEELDPKRAKLSEHDEDDDDDQGTEDYGGSAMEEDSSAAAHDGQSDAERARRMQLVKWLNWAKAGKASPKSMASTAAPPAKQASSKAQRVPGWIVPPEMLKRVHEAYGDEDDSIKTTPQKAVLLSKPPPKLTGKQMGVAFPKYALEVLSKPPPPKYTLQDVVDAVMSSVGSDALLPQEQAALVKKPAFVPKHLQGRLGTISAKPIFVPSAKSIGEPKITKPANIRLWTERLPKANP